MTWCRWVFLFCHYYDIFAGNENVENLRIDGTVI